MRQRPSLTVWRWLRALTVPVGFVIVGCTHERLEVRALPSQAPPTRTSAEDANSARLIVVVTPDVTAQHERRPAPTPTVDSATSPPTAAFPLDAPPSWGVQLRVERVRRCRVTETGATQRELVTHYSPSWVVYAAGFTALGIGAKGAIDETDSPLTLPAIVGGACILASTILFRSESVEAIAPASTQRVLTEPCGSTLDGPHKLTFGPNSAVRRVFIPRSGERFVAGVTPEMFESVFLDGDPVEVVRGAQGLGPPPLSPPAP